MTHTKKPQWSLISMLVILAVGVVIFFRPGGIEDSYPVATSTPSVVGQSTNTFPTKEPLYGAIALRIGEVGVFRNLSITPKVVVEDSRCPMDAQCIWSGRFRVAVEVVSAMGTSTQTMEVGDSMTTEAEEIKFVNVIPGNKSASGISLGEYRMTFEVSKKEISTKPTPAPISKKCFVGGCSGQICSDRTDMVSTCEWRSDYACYQTAKCEVQAGGQCGWTQTNELQMCLENPPAL
ncbi:MAG: hypothetical protein AB200_03045 [Parcubacteria bacterium C7867-005]|nr:MAG: hypothetical protein AB200_03045 [Parcubacteria bacterium C7867-005]